MDKLLKNKTAIILFAGPALLLFTAVLFVPICISIYYSFCSYAIETRAYTFVGLKNYTDMLKDPIMLSALKNSLFFLVFSCVSQLIMGMILAGLFMTGGYYLAEGIMYGNWAVAILGIPWNIAQFAVGAALAVALNRALAKTSLRSHMAYAMPLHL